MTDRLYIHENPDDKRVYTCFDFYIPQRMNRGIRRWIQLGAPAGEFLMSVFENDLMGALTKADDENRKNLAAYMYFLYNLAPAGCFGSKEKAAAWRKSGGLVGQEKERDRAKD